jgi:aquaporin Z
MEVAELAIFMVSASVFTILLYHPASPAARAIPSEFLRRLMIGLAMGLTLIGLVYSPWGKRSGAHMNPAFTLTFWRLGKVAPWDAVLYSLSQFLGGLGGMLLVAAGAAPLLSHRSVNYVATVPGPGGPWVAFVAETVISFVLMLVVLILTNRASLARYTGVVAGVCVAAFITFESPLSGMSMNPARTLGSAFLPHLWQSLWIYFTAPPLGMLVAAEVYLLCRCHAACAKYHHQNHFRCIFCEYQASSKMDRHLNFNRNPDPHNTPIERAGSRYTGFSNRFDSYLVLIAGLVLVPSTTVMSQTHLLSFQSAESQTSLLELYTSEGCSSCPAAEKWLSGLKVAPGLWKEFVPASFHVDYWDYLGWRDVWASKSFSDRQRAFAQLWRNDSVYTPGFVLNGQEWRTWSRQKNGPPVSSAKVGVLLVSTTDRAHWQVSFTPVGQRARDYDVHGASLANELISDVKAGENQGRRLKHDFVVTALMTGALRRQGDKLEGEFEFKTAKPQETKRLALAFWVTSRGSLEPLQAVGGWLPN